MPPLKESPAGSRAPLLICLLLALLTLAVYWPVFQCEFTNYDDDLYVTKNPWVQRGLTWDGVRWAFTTRRCTNWHPLTWISHMADCDLYGMDPAGHHATNLLLHAANAVLIFLVLLRMTGAQWRSAFVAALFALHPLHVESVAWVAERKDVLSTFFCMLALWAYARYAQEPTNSPSEAPNANCAFGTGNSPMPNRGSAEAAGRRRALRYAAVLVFFAFGLMAKPMLVTFPLLLLLLDFWPLRRLPATVSLLGRAVRTRERVEESGSQTTPARLIVEKLPMLALSIASCALTLWAQQDAVGTLKCPLPFRLANATVSYLRYIKKMIWPEDLVVLYPLPHSIEVGKVLVAAVALAGVTFLAVRHARTRPYLLTGWLWFLGTLVPVIGVVQVGAQSMADRYTYFPMLGLFIIIAWGAGDVATRWRVGRAVCASAAVLALAACIPLTRLQLGYWKNSVVLCQHALRYTSDNFILKCNLAEGYFDQGRLDDAIKECRELVRLKPDFTIVHVRLGIALTVQGHLDEAIGPLQRAAQLNPSDSFVHNYLGNVLREKGRYVEAAAQFQEVLRLDPNNASARQSLNALQGPNGR